MINFKQFPKSKELTYTIIERINAKKLQIALDLAHITDYRIRTCNVHDKSMLDDIKEHLPEWFDARYAVLISHFRPEDITQNIDKIRNDIDVNAALEDEHRIVQTDYIQNYQR